MVRNERPSSASSPKDPVADVSPTAAPAAAPVAAPAPAPAPTDPTGSPGTAPGWRDVPIDWEALEDAFENNAPEVHSYLHVPTGDVLRIVDGVADPQMHARIAADVNYLRIEPVSSREQYRWMERYIPMAEDPELQARLNRAIDGKGAFRRFKDVLMSYGPERERWFAFRSERLRIFMEAWLNAHALNPVKRTVWLPEPPAEEPPPTQPPVAAVQEPREARPARGVEGLRRQLHELVESLGPRDLDTLAAFGEFLRSRRASIGRSRPVTSRPGMPSASRTGFADDGDASSDPGADPADGGESDGLVESSPRKTAPAHRPDSASG